MGRIVDIVGQSFGLITVLEHAGFSKDRHATYLCACKCGTRWVTSGASLRSGKTASCGCVKARKITARNKTHGYAQRGERVPEYAIWVGIKCRCLNPESEAYKNYGGRGITICEAWKNDFTRFLADMGPRPHPKLTIERVDNNRGYSPDNCVWDTYTAQARNKRNNRPVIRGDGVAFANIAEAVEAVGGSFANIVSTCKGRQKTSGGFTWRYAEKDPTP